MRYFNELVPFFIYLFINLLLFSLNNSKMEPECEREMEKKIGNALAPVALAVGKKSIRKARQVLVFLIYYFFSHWKAKLGEGI